jgi:Fur family ferric uptake transcriptional regulator
MVVPILEQARQQVRSTGARVTDARVKALSVLLQADEALTHTEVQRRLERAGANAGFDRVTLYRVLEWLVETGLAHRVSGPDRVWRFSAHGGGDPGASHAQHGHFKCRGCERMVCMASSGRLGRSVRAMLPDGCVGESIELTVVGLCADCVARGTAMPPQAPQGAAHH